MKIGDKIHFYIKNGWNDTEAIGEIVGETKTLWKVKRGMVVLSIKKSAFGITVISEDECAAYRHKWTMAKRRAVICDGIKELVGGMDDAEVNDMYTRIAKLAENKNETEN